MRHVEAGNAALCTQIAAVEHALGGVAGAEVTGVVDRARPDVRDRAGVTPLIYAGAAGSLEAMTLLLDQGADVNAQNAFGSTALVWSATQIEKDRLLLDRVPDAPPLWLAGGAGDAAAPWLRALEQPPLAGRAVHLGYVAHGRRLELYTQASMLVPLPGAE